jgi:nucleotide-binding universal stress UspA family protein
MYKKILIATDGSAASAKAVEQGVALAKATGASVLLVTVTEMWSALDVATAAESGIANPVAEYEALADKSAQKALAAAAAIAKSAGVPAETLHVRDSVAAEGVAATAKKNGSDLIVAGTHGRRGLNRLFLGSQAQKILQLSEVPVLVVR